MQAPSIHELECYLDLQFCADVIVIREKNSMFSDVYSCIVGYVESGNTGRKLKSSFVKTNLNVLFRTSALFSEVVAVPLGVWSALFLFLHS